MASTQPAGFTHDSFHGQIGIARVDITPPVGIYARNWGAAKHDVADSIHLPLKLTVLTLSSAAPDTDQNGPLVFIDADLGWWKTPQTFIQFQQQLLAELQLAPEQVIFALTHTHSGPPLMQSAPELPGYQLHLEWSQTLVQSTIDGVRDALKSSFEGTLDWHVGRCSLANVRDLPDPNPKASRVLCGFDPNGNPDDTLLLGRVTDLSGRIRATVVNYACHPTTLAAENTSISPDYIGAMRRVIEENTEAHSLFMLGACGDLAPRFQYVGDTEIADRHGRQLGFAALATLHDMEPAGTRLSYSGVLESGAPLAVWKHEPRELSSALVTVMRTVELPLKDWPSADDLERQRVACTDRALKERLRRRVDIRRAVGDESTYQLPIYAWRMGEAVLVGCCCEPYSQLQQTLRQRFAGRALVCMNLINGSLGYLPPDAYYDKDIYPVWQTPFDRGSLEKLIEAMNGVIEDVIKV